MKRALAIAAAPILLLGLLSACGGESEPRAGAAPPDAAVPAMPDDFRLALVKGGGFTGAWTETEARPDGLVLTRESRGGAATQVAMRGVLRAEARDALWRALHRHAYFDMRGSPGNLSDSIVVTARGETTNVAFGAGSAPRAFRDLLAALAAHVAEVDPVDPRPLATDDGVEIAVSFVPAAGGDTEPDAADASSGSPGLRFEVTNRSAGPLRIPNGRSAAAYMEAPLGLELDLRDANGEPFAADPGAGGPVLPLGPEHFTRLAPGETLTLVLRVGGYVAGFRPRLRVLGREPGLYVASARWACAQGIEPTRGPGPATAKEAPVWRGATPTVRLPFVVK